MISFYEEIRNQVDSYINDCRKHYPMDLLNVYFRGQGKGENDWPLVPKVKRKGNQISEAESKRQAIDLGLWRSDSSLFENIARMQHYGLPTRFLDYTTEVDIALFFACSNPAHYDSDGILFVCTYDVRTAQHVDTCLLSELFALEQEITARDFSEHLLIKYKELKEIYQPNDLGSNILSWVDHGFMTTPSEAELDRLKIWNRRLFNQHGVFFAFGNKLKDPNLPRSTSSTSIHIILPEIADTPSIIQHPNFVKRVIISKEAKPDIIKTLAKRGINQEFLLPDC